MYMHVYMFDARAQLTLWHTQFCPLQFLHKTVLPTSPPRLWGCHLSNSHFYRFPKIVVSRCGCSANHTVTTRRAESSGRV